MNGTPPNTQEEAQIVTLAADGTSTTKIAAALGRSRHMVKNTLAKPEIQQSIQQEKAELSKMYRETARRVVASISDTDIGKASLQQKAISSGVLLDKALLLAGEPTSNVDVRVLMELVDEIRDKRDRPPVLSLPANPA
jgi:ABC-type cobalamin/Fe3+-siderophores transport system ATPase subunit